MKRIICLLMNAEKLYKKALKAGYVPAIKPYLAFKEHRKAAKAEKKKKKQSGLAE